MKLLNQLAMIALLFGGLAFSAHAGFSSIYVFGDSLSATATNNASGSETNYYYGGTLRYSNGRTWVEVLAQRQGLGANSTTNATWDYSRNSRSYYYHLSSDVVTNVKAFSPPTNVANCLFVVWVNNADIVADILNPNVGAPNGTKGGTNLALWNTAINQHLTNHFNIITNLYARGCRTLVAPNAADVTTIPEFNNASAAYRAFVRQRIISFNTNYTAMINQTMASCPGLTVYVPDIFSLLDNVLTNAASYGLTNVIYDQGYGNGPTSIDAVSAFEAGLLPSAALNGPGNRYIFWDYEGNPTANMGEVIADYVQQCISPVRISTIAAANGANQMNVTLNVANLPIGLNGFVDGCTNLTLANWTPVTNINSFATTQAISVVAPPFPGVPDGYFGSGGGGGSIDPSNPGTNSAPYIPLPSSSQFYSLRFPLSWTWP